MQLTKREDLILINFLAQTHPDQEFVEWVEDGNKDLQPIYDSLQKKGLLEVNSLGEYAATSKAIAYVRRPVTPDPVELLKKLEKLVPKNPSFQSMLEGLTDTALVRAFYDLLGEVGRRGNPDVPAKYGYWLEKCKAFELALKDAEPNGLWEKHGNK